MTEKAKPIKAKAKKHKKKNNLLKLCTEMGKVAFDAVDKEIIKRFKTLIDTCEEDITKSSLDLVIKHSKDVEVGSFPESLQPYIKHYLFMKKREKK